MSNSDYDSAGMSGMSILLLFGHGPSLSTKDEISCQKAWLEKAGGNHKEIVFSCALKKKKKKKKFAQEKNVNCV